MNRMLRIAESTQTPQKKLKLICELVEKVAAPYGSFFWDEEVLKFYYYDAASEHIQRLTNVRSHSVYEVKETPSAYTQPVVSALEKEYFDKRIIQSALTKINRLPFDLKQLFYFRYFNHYSVEKIKDVMTLSNKRYYQMLQAAMREMIEQWGLDLDTKQEC